MRGEQFFRILGYTDPALIMRADKETHDNYAQKLWRTMSAVAACLIIAVSTVLLLPYIPRTYALDYEYYADGELSEPLGYKNVWIYYPRGERIDRRRVKLPSSIDNVFITWRHLSGIGDQTELLGYSYDADGYGNDAVAVSCEISDDITLLLFISSDIMDAVDQAHYPLLAKSLERTVTEYLRDDTDGIETKNSADSGADTGIDTSPDTQADTSAVTDGTTDATDTTATTQPPKETEEERLEKEKKKKEELYELLTQAISDKEYQYAHSLAAYLALDDHLDTREIRTSLTRRANARYFVSTYMDSVAGANCSLDAIPENASMINGVLYIGEGGTPRFIYYDDYDVLQEIVPDTTLKDVVSIIESPNYYMRQIPQFYQCITKDGDVRILYNPRLVKEGIESQSSEFMELNSLIEFTQGLVGVSKIVYEPESINCAYLHEDGRVSMFLTYYRNQTQADREAIERVGEWSDIVDMSYSGFEIIGLRKDGSIAWEFLREQYLDNPSFNYPTPFYSYLSEQGLRISSFGSSDLAYTAGFRVFIDGVPYQIRPNKLGEADSVKDIRTGALHHPKYAFITQIGTLYVDTDGYIAVSGSPESDAWEDIITCKGICSISAYDDYSNRYAFITREGKILHVLDENDSYDEEIYSLLDMITVNVD